jgi:hypothetical protein
MLNYYGIDWIAMTFTFTAIYLLGEKKRYAFLIGIVGNMFWLVFGVFSHSIATIVANIIIMSLNARGYIKWGRSTNG